MYTYVQYTLYTLTYLGNMHSVTYWHTSPSMSVLLCHTGIYLYSLHSFIYNFFLYAIDAGEHPTGPPRDHQAAHPPLRARRSESAAPATLTCWSDPDPVAEEGAVQGAVGSAFNITGSISK